MMIETIGIPNEPTKRKDLGVYFPALFANVMMRCLVKIGWLIFSNVGNRLYIVVKQSLCCITVCYGACVEKTVCFIFGEKTMWQYGYLQARSTEFAERTIPNPNQSLQDGHLMFGSSLSELKFLESRVCNMLPNMLIHFLPADSTKRGFQRILMSNFFWKTWCFLKPNSNSWVQIAS